MSAEAVAAADCCAIVPMAGMVASLNVSVAAAMVLYEARSQRIARLGAHGDLTPQQRRLLKAVMLLRHMVRGGGAGGTLGAPCTLGFVALRAAVDGERGGVAIWLWGPEPLQGLWWLGWVAWSASRCCEHSSILCILLRCARGIRQRVPKPPCVAVK